jgi:hypothetical protein
MPGKEMFPHVPQQALAKLQPEYETAEISPNVRILADGVLLWFSQPTHFVLMRSGGARKLAPPQGMRTVSQVKRKWRVWKIGLAAIAITGSIFHLRRPVIS